ncbi:hypothetical protein PIB30_096598 [Stylosanthes scabra]|uniref:Uncharacterized protein n=1 Tax=Stylosanthes scabra TaxID=79078 RepID=A0ABU6YVC2_9FABA|nr:hypothetical protein [Stylosanthes scabra]
MYRELMNHRKNFSTHMGKVHIAQEENKAKINQIVLSHSLDSQEENMYTHWGLQQGFPSLVLITPAKIPRAIRNNFRAGKPLFEGMLCPWPPEGSTLVMQQIFTIRSNPTSASDQVVPVKSGYRSHGERGLKQYP